MYIMAKTINKTRPNISKILVNVRVFSYLEKEYRLYPKNTNIAIHARNS
jgi:hypothetical protein